MYELIVCEWLNVPSYFLGIILECAKLSPDFRCTIYTNNIYIYISEIKPN